MMAVYTTSTLLSRTCRLTVSWFSLSYGYYTDCKSCFFHFAPNLLPVPPSTVFSNSLPIHLSHRNPLGLSISKRDSLLEKCAMFREAGGALCRQPLQDNGLDGPFSSGASKLEQVPCCLTPPALQKTQQGSKDIDNSKVNKKKYFIFHLLLCLVFINEEEACHTPKKLNLKL